MVPVTGDELQPLTRPLTLVPGASAGSLLARSSNTEPFTFRAAHGFDMEQLKYVHLSEANMQNWYGMDRHAWEAGTICERGPARRTSTSPASW